jgi:hypothetical protein
MTIKVDDENIAEPLFIPLSSGPGQHFASVNVLNHHRMAITRRKLHGSSTIMSQDQAEVRTERQQNNTRVMP